jgi:formamidopyrimidine-DNA glycosylase
MPELPEVETVRKQLEIEIVGAQIMSVEVRELKIFIGQSTDIHGEKIVKICRAGKYLFVYFEKGGGLIVHLKMTGRIVLDDDFYETAKHTRVIIYLEDGRKVYYWDIQIWLFKLVKILEEHGKLRSKRS